MNNNQYAWEVSGAVAWEDTPWRAQVHVPLVRLVHTAGIEVAQAFHGRMLTGRDQGVQCVRALMSATKAPWVDAQTVSARYEMAQESWVFVLQGSGLPEWSGGLRPRWCDPWDEESFKAGAEQLAEVLGYA